MAGSKQQRGGTTGMVGPCCTDPSLYFSWPVAIVCAALCVVLSYPGRLNADSLFAVIAAGEPGQANNWHSATLGWFWGLPSPWLGQPVAALAMQATLFGAFAGFLPTTPPTVRGRVFLALELLLRLVLAGGAGYVGKDAVVVTTLLIAVQLLRRSIRTGFTWVSGVALALDVLLFLLIKAPNFFVVVVAGALILPFFVRSWKRYTALVAAGLVIGATAVPLNRTIDRYVFHARDVHPDKQLVIFDLAGISIRTSENAFAAVPGWPTASLPPLASCYLPYMWDAFAQWAPCGSYSDAYDRFDQALTRRWIGEIASHPVAYAQHRLEYLHWLLESRDHASWGLAGQAINDATAPDSLAEMDKLTAALHAAKSIGLWRPRIAVQADRQIALWRPSMASTVFAQAETTLFRFPKVQWAGLTACLATLLYAWTKRAEGIRFGAILASALGVGNFAMLAIFGVADPGRYMWPTVTLAYVALLALLVPPDTAKDQSSA